MHRVNYDEIAHLYDEPARDHVVDDNLLTFLASRSDLAPAQVRILDIGCGTGKQLVANRQRFPAMFMAGLDRFRGMLRIARKRTSDVAWVQGDGPSLPFPGSSFHYATNQFSYPHIRRTDELLAEVFRVLMPGGRFVMTNIDPWSMTNNLGYRYFTEALELDFHDFIPAEEFCKRMHDAGFRGVDVKRESRSQSESLPELLSRASQRHSASQFMAISDRAYANGIRRLQKDIARGMTEQIQSDFCLVTIRGDKP